MPHMILEHSANLLPEQNLLSELHATLGECATVKREEIKTRSLACQHYIVGDGDAGFVHLRVDLLAGRSVDLKKEIGTRLLAALKRAFPANNLQVSVEIRDMDRDTYCKGAR